MTLDEYIGQYEISDPEMNKEVINAFPWLQIHNAFSGEAVEDYRFTMLDEIPKGWRAAFAVPMCHEIQNEWNRIKRLHGEEFFILQWKEKYGTFRIYFSYYTKKLDEIEEKYNNISENVCIECGKPATCITTGWISPYCDDCAPRGERLEFL